MAKRFPCDICEFESPISTEVLNHKIKNHKEGAKGMDASEMFMNVVARQDLILEQMGKTENKWSDKLAGIEANQKSVCDDLKTLNECFGILKKEG